MSSSNDTSSTKRSVPPPSTVPSEPLQAPSSSRSRLSTSAATTGTGSAQRSLARAVWDRREEYTRSETIRLKIGSWNVAALPGTEKDLCGWFVEGKGISESLADLHIGRDEDWHVVQKQDGERGDKRVDSSSSQQEPIESVIDQEERANKHQSTVPQNDPGSVPAGAEIGLYVLGLQEIVDISSAAEALRPYNDPHPAKKWKQALSEALPGGYQLVAEQQLSGLLLLIYASPAVAPAVTSVSVTSVGTGLMGYMGNKGAVIARILLGEATRMVFVNSHLAAGTEKGSLDRRNWDASQIVSRTKFEPLDYGNGVIDEFSEVVGDEDFAFWFGDLNFRLDSLPGEDVRRLLMLHTRNEYDVSNASRRSIDKELETTRQSEDSSVSTASSNSKGTSSDKVLSEDELEPENDPASLQTTLSSLLPHDQLHQQMKLQKAFHDGWKEGPIKFLPTYKYDVGSVGKFDSSEKKRGPSWCDRILYRTRKDYLGYLDQAKEEASKNKRDAEMKARGLEESADEVIFDYDPETNGADEEEYNENEDVGEEEYVETKSGYQERLRLEYYTSHQRVLSSDHKPLDAIFELTYAAVNPGLKTEVYADVARELDKDENESRPTITMIVDHAEVKDVSSQGIDFGDISYDDPKTRSITIANIGRVSATFGFVHDMFRDRCQKWLHSRFDVDLQLGSIEFQECTIEPGETINAIITIHIKQIDDVRLLNVQKKKIEDILVLRVRDGRDYFVSVHGSWLNSAFGLSLQQLVRVPEGGVRSCALDANLEQQEVKWSAPRELFRLTEALEELLERAVAEWGMKEEYSTRPPWDAAGWPFLSSTWTTTAVDRAHINSSIRNSLDSGAPFAFSLDLTSIQKVEALADTLLIFLDSLDEGIIDDHLWTTLSSALQEQERQLLHHGNNRKPFVDPEAVRSLILDIISTSPARSVAFTFITFMLARVANEVVPSSSLPSTDLSPTRRFSSEGGGGVIRGVGGVLGRVRALSSGASGGPQSEKRREVVKKFVEVFAGVIFKIEKEAKGKEKKIGYEGRKGVLATFLQGPKLT